jgi:uncharacterized protein (DUF1697 family)
MLQEVVMRSVAFLRGINVGGRNMVKMPRLTQIAESIGAIEVTTYLQSGNVLLDSSRVAPELDRALEAALADELGFDVPVVTRSGVAMAKIARSHPLCFLAGRGTIALRGVPRRAALRGGGSVAGDPGRLR